MFIKSKNYGNCVQKVKIEIGTNVGLESADEAYIVLKELPTIEMLKLKEASEKSENEILTLFKELIPLILIEHNFYEDEKAQKKMSNKDVTSIIFDSLDLTVKVVDEYTKASFFTRAEKIA
ncbi:MAG: hypothetical protein WC162_09915 [Sphaerochaetaceae bacterium]